MVVESHYNNNHKGTTKNALTTIHYLLVGGVGGVTRKEMKWVSLEIDFYPIISQ